MLKARLYYRLQEAPVPVKSLFGPWWSKDFDDKRQALQYYIQNLLGPNVKEVKLFEASELPLQSASEVFPPSESCILDVTTMHIRVYSPSGGGFDLYSLSRNGESAYEGPIAFDGVCSNECLERYIHEQGLSVLAEEDDDDDVEFLKNCKTK